MSPVPSTPAAAPGATAPLRKPESESKPAPTRPHPRALALPTPIAILGVPFDQVTAAQTLHVFGQMIASGRPHCVATANVDFVVQALADIELQRILADADLVLCDGMPLVQASRLLGNPLPERVAGADLVPQLLAEAERRGWRVYFLGGTEASIARAAENVRKQHPQLQLVGSYSPPFKPLLEMDHDDIVRRVRDARPDILLVAFGCPKQEKWINMQFRQTGVPVSIGVGATIDFLGGSVLRAPLWMQRTGLEWLFRLLQEPRRLFRRYLTDFWVFGRAILRQWWHLHGIRRHAGRNTPATCETIAGGVCAVVRAAEHLNTPTVHQHQELWTHLAESEAHAVIDLSQVRFIDSTGVGLLVRLQKQFRAEGRQLVLAAPTKPVLRALALMRLTEFLPMAADLAAARALIEERIVEQNVVVTRQTSGTEKPLVWQGDIGAANKDEVWSMTQMHLEHLLDQETRMQINLAGVRFIDSTGVGLMVRARKEALRRGIQIKFVEPSPAVLSVLRTLRMEQKLLE
ncbi:MAG: WecB/TagA/CpsF family glycosyltransferase [Verrucomicrobiota bacterium]